MRSYREIIDRSDWIGRNILAMTPRIWDLCGAGGISARKLSPHVEQLIGCIAISGALIGMPCLSIAQTPATDVAAQIRSQGYQCDQPVTATRDVKRSKPDLAVWVLKCRNAIYRVRLDPGMAAHVTKLKKQSY
jgi:hypothetical protein